MATRPPLPPFTRESAIQKVRLAEDGWNTCDPEKVALAYSLDSRWRNRSEFVNGRQEIIAFLTRKWAKELDYRLIKELWAFRDNRIAVRFQYEWHDDSGNWLYAALHRAGFATQATATAAGDGLKLRGAFITASARCAPPDNKPSPAELAACAAFLDRELALLVHVRVVVALGQIAWGTVLGRARRADPASFPSPVPKFGHGAETNIRLTAGGPAIALLGSYHPSRQNTNTGRLTRAMWHAVFRRARAVVGGVA
jgi:uracil-DNA glycosylase family 4